jgi:uncharacterized protein (DUF427 family)
MEETASLPTRFVPEGDVGFERLAVFGGAESFGEWKGLAKYLF